MGDSNKWNINFKIIGRSSLFALLFYSIAIWTYKATGVGFYLFNFGYIGTAIAFKQCAA